VETKRPSNAQACTHTHTHGTKLGFHKFYILLTVHLGTNLVNSQLDAQFLCVYLISLHVSSNPVLTIMRINCVNTTSRTDKIDSPDDEHVVARNMYRSEINA
jgi:uncharacterized cupin superfamily protein